MYNYRPLAIACCLANSMYEMYKFLVDKLPEHPDVPKEMRLVLLKKCAKSDARTLDNLTPMQLAMKMGHKTMVKQILHQQTRVLWKWGPVTQYEVDLECVDSAGEGNDLMELGELLTSICPVRVLRSTTTRSRCYSSWRVPLQWAISMRAEHHLHAAGRIHRRNAVQAV